MLAEERHNVIIAQITRDGSVLVKELSKQFGVTDDCIRKDLTLLEKKGFLKKTYGGAMKIHKVAHVYQMTEKKEKSTEDKQFIARKAMGLIKTGDTIFLDISAVNVELARFLAESEKRVTIVTNSFEVVQVTNIPCNLKVIALGGGTTEQRRGVTGALTNEQISHYHFHVSFMGTSGVNLEKNCVYTMTPEDGSTKSIALRNCMKSYLMMESRKFGTDGIYSYAKASDFSGIIMEKEPEKDIADILNGYGIAYL